MRRIRIGRTAADVYCSLIPAMVVGRIAGGCVQALVFATGTGSYSISLWASSYFVLTLPGAIMQLILLPCIVLVLTRAKLIPARYPSAQKER